MSFLSKLIKQCRRPSGWLGELTALRMNSGHARMTTWALGHLHISKEYVILDVGCGGGRTVNRLAKLAFDGKVMGLDFSESSVKISTKTNRDLIKAGRVEIRQGSVSEMPFQDDTFDLVTAVETYYFWPDLNADLREVRRVLKPEGRLLILVEAYKGSKYEERNLRWVKAGDMAYHSPQELKDLLITAGFTDVEMFEKYEKGWACTIGKKDEQKT